MSEYADIRTARRAALSAGLRPPPRLSLSEWADEYFRLSAESSAQAGRWTTLPYQREILDCITDPTVTQISLKKSARVGYTLMVSAAVGYHIHQSPCSILLVQPTVDDAKGFSKETIAPMLRDVPVLSRIVFEDAEENGPKDSGNTILHKRYPGGVLSMVGANSGAGFRRVSRKVVIFDEVDGYPPSAGSDGDQIKLGIKRSEYFWDRKIIAGSTPLVAGTSRIEALYEAGDQRRYFVPCPHCEHMAPLVFRGDGGHVMTWPEGEPEKAFFTCQENGCVIEHQDKRDMVTRGEWRASAPFTGHASFHIWAAYSFSPNASWGQLAQEFVASKGSPEQLRTYVNTVLGETWKEKGEAPEWQRLFERRATYPIGTVPEAVKFLTSGVDVQKDRVVYEVVGWGEGKQSWSVDAGVIPMDTSNETQWTKLDDLLNRAYSREDGSQMAILCMAVDSGYNTQMIYNWARQHQMSRVIAVKGVHTAKTILGAPTPVDVTVRGKRLARGYKVWPVGVDIAKSELYGWLKLADPEAPGYCTFPEYGQDFFKQLTAEHLVSVVNKRTGFTSLEWQILPNRENHQLDTRVYARVAAALVGLDRMRSTVKAAPASSVPRVAPVLQPPTAPKPKRQISDSGFLGNRGRNWLRR